MKKILIALSLFNLITVLTVSATDYSDCGGTPGNNVYCEANSETVESYTLQTWYTEISAPITATCYSFLNGEDGSFSYEIYVPVEWEGNTYSSMSNYVPAYGLNQTFNFDSAPGDITFWGWNWHAYSNLAISW